jgi:hypothetical protein
MTHSSGRRHALCLAAKRAYDDAMAVGKDKLQIGTQEWHCWRELNRKMVWALDAYAAEVHTTNKQRSQDLANEYCECLALRTP